MSLQESLSDALHEIGAKPLSQLLGYRSSENIVKRIKSIINSPYLALDQSSYDLKYSNPELIIKLAEIIGIPSLCCERIIDEINIEIEKNNKKFKSYIFIETNFKRSSEPVIILAALQSSRFIKIDSDIQSLSLNNQIAKIQDIVRSHYNHQSALKLWGEIQKYIYYYANDLAIHLSTSGEIIGCTEEYFHSKATLSL